eukprot:scaffold2190_cov118-Isochrysis_galbana.AAC.1
MSPLHTRSAARSKRALVPDTHLPLTSATLKSVKAWPCQCAIATRRSTPASSRAAAATAASDVALRRRASDRSASTAAAISGAERTCRADGGHVPPSAAAARLVAPTCGPWRAGQPALAASSRLCPPRGTSEPPTKLTDDSE